MSDAGTTGVIRPEVLATKLAAIRNHEYPKLLEQIRTRPRLVEMLWFIQWKSMQPGGLGTFAEELTAQVPEHFRTDTMPKAGPAPLSLESKLRIYEEIPQRLRPKDDGCPITEPEWDPYDLSVLIEPETAPGRPARRPMATAEERAAVGRYFESWTFETFAEICRKAAREVLPGYLVALCNEIDKDFTRNYWSVFTTDLWFIDDPVATLFDMMDRHADAVSKRLAMTSVAALVYDALDFAFEERAMVKIVGNPRFGKTEALRAWCEMRPGRARFVNVPSSNSLSDLHRAFGQAAGMDVSYGSRHQRLKERLEHVLQQSGLFFVLDEGAFLMPQNYSATTPPARLNWVRTEVTDRGLPLALVVTPQNFDPLVDRYVKKTGYAMEQFLGRVVRTVVLPEELTPAEMVDVARIHFPEMGTEYLELIADLASVSENYLQAVESIAKVARHRARRAGRVAVTVDDIEGAASEVVRLRPAATAPAIQKPDSDSPEEPPSRRSRAKVPCKADAGALQAARNARAENPVLPSSSLRDAGPEREFAETLSAPS
jgi:hypothetical protein